MKWSDVRRRELIGSLVDYLTGKRILPIDDWRSRVWYSGLFEVPRDLFVPTTGWAVPFTEGKERAIDRRRDAGDWLKAVYSDTTIVTQRDDGATDPADPSGMPTSSLTLPSQSLALLGLLDVHDHHRVLEVGTGTGWTAGMLAWRLGHDRVVTVEIDKDLAEIARANLGSAGLDPPVAAGDGEQGFAEHAPYDRIHVTCGVRDVPAAWIEQARPGGVIVLPWLPPVTSFSGGHRLRLDVVGDGVAVGRFDGSCGYMLLRGQRHSSWSEPAGEPLVGTTLFDPRTISSLSDNPVDQGATVLLAALLPRVEVQVSRVRRQSRIVHTTMLRDLESDAQATCEAVDGEDKHTVTQYGSRRLWEELEAAYLEWIRLGRPARDRFGLTVSAGAGIDIWLDTPGQRIAPISR
ncbi:methyltransferase domain-containing protein [Sinosporangium siamense]|uniref:Protein-L-isoaspartate O-methyltransferase n=1 Tax=Sinosporangium siamense TaxID=1367973 RepID=A0A919RAQ8_9ACTN|nr:methyltransferase domain-containing protein [Sinosporangium siamense]GII90448.1 hypothetical protein Ssi02_06790 [Sinosporangium siamense]